MAINVKKMKRARSNLWVKALVLVGLVILLIALVRSVLAVMDAAAQSLDPTSVDQAESGFLPVYVEEGEAMADPEFVALPEPASPEGSAVASAEAGSGEVTNLEYPGVPPERLVIPAIGVDAPVQPVDYAEFEYEGHTYQQWQAPEGRVAGWHRTSAGLGAIGNTVFNGHHNIQGEVFRDLYQLKAGDEITLFSQEQEFHYVVVLTQIVPERNQALAVRLANAEWIRPTKDERVTLITCWPYASNTHRVVVVAVRQP